ncbi:MAG: methyltransferase [Proteobacteria bacterium]|jgi:predicted nicotinamide N-methyase|nr:50S ribosomal protein L11 methyltransferase [Alphaproteobacteria bacterium]NCC02699.1 methyltransferase [Pseudomonadota bacterium]
MKIDFKAFIRSKTTKRVLPFLPELSLRLALDGEQLWDDVIQHMRDPDADMPYWAFAWPGGVGLARYILDNPAFVAGKIVLDFASGSGVCALAASKAGAKTVYVCDIDPFAQAAIDMNAQDNNCLNLVPTTINFAQSVLGIDVLLAGDVCYEHLMAHRTIKWLRLCSENANKVIIGDPMRAYAPKESVALLGKMTVPTSVKLEEVAQRDVSILQIFPS